MCAVPVHLSGVYSKPDKNEIVLSFFCEITGGTIQLTDEADQIEYFHLDRIPSNTSPKQVERIKDYFADKTRTYYKVQTGPSAIDLVNEGKIEKYVHRLILGSCDALQRLSRSELTYHK